MAFGLRYYAELRSKFKEAFWRVEIAERDYRCSAEVMKFDHDKPLTITWENRGDEFYIPVKASEATINIHCIENFKYIGLFTSDPRRYRVSIYRNTKLYWRGFVVADLYSESFSAPPYKVSIKAVDGFKLLENIPFRRPDGSYKTGRYHLCDLVAECIALMELNMTVDVWLNLFAEGMDISDTSLKQVYIDLDRLYKVYEEATYRDVLELCLRPFAGQIFQSNGSLHVRRIISLYEKSRPQSFTVIGKTLPSGWKSNPDGQHIYTSSGVKIVTSQNREQVESIWDKDISISGESTLDIVPALKSVTVSVKNKGAGNMIPQIGFYNLSSWNDPYGFLSLTNDTTLRFLGNKDRQGYVIETKGYPLTQCSYTLTLEYSLRAQYAKYGSSYRTTGTTEHIVKFYYGLKLIGKTKTYWLQDDGQWVTSEGFIMDEVKTSTEINRKIEIEGIPESGTLKFYIKQTLIYNVTGSGRGSTSGSSSGGTTNHPSYTRSGEWEAVSFYNMSLTMDTGDDYEKSLSRTTLINQANNVEMGIDIPISDIPNIPNAESIYTLFFTDKKGAPTRMWYSKGKNDHNTLINHITQCALRLKRRPSRRITGEIFTGKMIDLNTIIEDEKYLQVGFYINSLELDALGDIYNVELVEMPGFLDTEQPAPGDDCILARSLDFTVRKVVTTEHMIVLLSTDNRIYGFDTATGNLSLFKSYTKTVNINSADNGFCIVDGTIKGSTVTLMDYRGVAMKKYVSTNDISIFATYMGGYPYIITPVWVYPYEQTPYFSHNSLTRPGHPYVPDGVPGRVGYNSLTLGKVIKSLRTSNSAVVVNTGEKAYLLDSRATEGLDAQVLPDNTEVLSVSDYYMTENDGTYLKIYRRNTFSERSLITYMSPVADHAAHTLGEVAYSRGTSASIRSFSTGITKFIKNNAGKTRVIRGLCYINGELFIVRTNAIYKFIP